MENEIISFPKSPEVTRSEVEGRLQAIPLNALRSKVGRSLWGLLAAGYLLTEPVWGRFESVAIKFKRRPATGWAKCALILEEHWDRLARDPSQRDNVRWFQERIRQAIATGVFPSAQIGGQSHPTDLSSAPEPIIKLAEFFLPVIESGLSGPPAASVRKFTVRTLFLTRLP